MAPCSLASRVIPRITDSVNEWVRRAVCIEAEVTRERPRRNSPGPSHAYSTYALEKEPEVLAGDDLARGQHDREPPLGAAFGPQRGGLEIEIPLLRADRVAAGGKTGEAIVPVGVRLNRRNGRASEHDEPTPDTDLARITEAITVGVIEHCAVDLPTRGRGRRRRRRGVALVDIGVRVQFRTHRAMRVVVTQTGLGDVRRAHAGLALQRTTLSHARDVRRRNQGQQDYKGSHVLLLTFVRAEEGRCGLS